MREFIEAAKLLNEGEVHRLAPDVGALYTVNATGEKYRVNGWLKKAPPPPPEPDLDDPNTTMDDILSDILYRGHRDDLGPDKTRLMWCTRQEAEYVAGSGVSGNISRISDITVTGMVPWSKKALDSERASALRLVGQMIF